MSKEIIVSTLKINVLPAVISANWEQAEADIVKKIKDKKFLITPETIQDGKDDAAALRKDEANLAKDWKTVDELVNGDYNKAVSWVKKFRKLYLDGAREISDQVDKIESETKEICRMRLKNYLADSWESNDVILEFRKASIDGLVKLGSLTPKGELTKAAKQAVDSLVAVDLSKQTTIQARLMSVEIKSLRADIQPLLSRANVEAFLYADDFESRLDTLIQAEVERKAEAEERLRKKLEAEKQMEIEAALKAQQAEANRIAKEEADKQIAESKLAQVEKKPVEDKPSPTPTLEKRLSHLATMNAIYADNETTGLIESTKEDLAKAQGSTNYTLKFIVEFSIASRPDADTEKMKEFFVGKLNGSVEAEGKRVTLISLVKDKK